MRPSSRSGAIPYRAAAAPPSRPAASAARSRSVTTPARTHDIVDLEECPILLPQIAQALPHLRAALTRRHASEERGEDFGHRGGQRPRLRDSRDPRCEPAANAKVIDTLGAAGFIRAIWNGEPRAARRGAVRFIRRHRGDASARRLPAGRRSLRAGYGGLGSRCAVGREGRSGPICDLFAGLGAFTFPAARLAPVTAYEENQSAVAALTAAAKRAKGLKAVTAIRRDLYRNPAGTAGTEQIRAPSSSIRPAKERRRRPARWRPRRPPPWPCFHAIRQALPATPPF